MSFRRPSLRQQFVQLRHRHRGHAGQDAAEVGLGVEAMTFGAGDEAVERGGPLGGLVMAGKQPVLSSDADAPKSAFGSVVVNVKEALRGITAQRIPLIEHVADGLCPGADTQLAINALMDDSGSVAQSYRFKAFGLPDTSMNTGMTWGARKQYYTDAELELYFLGTGAQDGGGRYYDPASGKFLSDDALRQAAGDLNLSRYAGNNPVQNVDPNGKDAYDEIINPGGRVANKGDFGATGYYRDLVLKAVEREARDLYVLMPTSDPLKPQRVKIGVIVGPVPDETPGSGAPNQTLPTYAMSDLNKAAGETNALVAAEYKRLGFDATFGTQAGRLDLYDRLRAERDQKALELLREALAARMNGKVQTAFRNNVDAVANRDTLPKAAAMEESRFAVRGPHPQHDGSVIWPLVGPTEFARSHYRAGYSLEAARATNLTIQQTLFLFQSADAAAAELSASGLPLTLRSSGAALREAAAAREGVRSVETSGAENAVNGVRLRAQLGAEENLARTNLSRNVMIREPLVADGARRIAVLDTETGRVLVGNATTGTHFDVVRMYGLDAVDQSRFVGGFIDTPGGVPTWLKMSGTYGSGAPNTTYDFIRGAGIRVPNP